MKKMNVFEGVSVRFVEDGDEKYAQVSMSGLEKVKENAEWSEGKIVLEATDDEGIFVITEGKEKINLVAKKQEHTRLGEGLSWKMAKEKFADGTWVKLNGYKEGFYEAWTNHPDYTGKARQKRVFKMTSKSKAEAAYKKLVAELKAKVVNE